MFNFNFYSSLLLIGFVQAIIYSILLLNRGKREERIADYFAAGILIVGALYVAQWMLGFAGWYDSRDWRTTIMFYVKWGNLALLGPFIWFYFRSLTNGAFQWQKRYWVHLLLWAINSLPALLIFLYDVIYFRILTGRSFEFFSGSRGPFAEYDNTNAWLIMTILYYLTRVQLLVYLVLVLVEFKKYQRYVKEEFSNAEQLNFNQFRNSLYLFLGGLVLLVGLSTLNRLASLDYDSAWNSFFVMSVIIYFAAVQFYRLDTPRTHYLRFEPSSLLSSVEGKSSVSNLAGSKSGPQSSNAQEKSNDQDRQGPFGINKEEQLPENLPLTEQVLSEDQTPTPENLAAQDETLLLWSLKLEKHLALEKSYLDPELNLTQLARQLKTNSSQLSKVINSVHGQNFNDFINGLRCAAFREALKAGDHHTRTLLSLALDSGFNSKATFNRAFKKCYGMSPGEAAKRIDRAT